VGAKVWGTPHPPGQPCGPHTARVDGAAQPAQRDPGQPELAGGELRALIIIDTNHPPLFDHIPGMLQFEAARQVTMAAANATLGLDTSRMVMHRLRIEFTNFGEFERDTVARSSVRPDEDGHGAFADVDLRQDEDSIASGLVQLKLLPVGIWTMVQ
jgi:hypothetical protein